MNETTDKNANVAYYFDAEYWFQDSKIIGYKQIPRDCFDRENI